MSLVAVKTCALTPYGCILFFSGEVLLFLNFKEWFLKAFSERSIALIQTLPGMKPTWMNPGGLYDILITIRNTKMMQGTVKWFNPTKGYGFIQPENGTSDVFVHITALQEAGLRTLDDGQKVSFEVATSRGKQSAVNLRVDG